MKLSEKPIYVDIAGKKEETQKLVLLALLPAVFVALIRFKEEAFAILLFSMGAVIFNFILGLFIKKEEERKRLSFGDCLICLLFGLTLPPGLPWYCIVAGSFFALLIGKYAFRTEGKTYFLNPALIARAFLLLSFAGYMGSVTYRGQVLKTPLESLMAGEGVNTMKLFLGSTAGGIGTISALAILLGAAFLLWFDVIRMETPIGILAGFLLIAFFSGTSVEGMHRFHYLVAECCSGGILFGAFFMATEPELLPKGRLKQLVYGLFIGLSAACLRFYGNSKEGITYAILAGNLLLPLAARMKDISEKRKKRKEVGADGNAETGSGTGGSAGEDGNGGNAETGSGTGGSTGEDGNGGSA